jgi:benzoyl-CoA reductase/2-hydroxyglutaryl-CoA dehydratase subunit BcrC/BadD/HgdB
MSASSPPFETLRHFRARAAAGETSYTGAVGVIGDGVPSELVLATGLRPTRLHCREGYPSGAGEYMGRGTEPWIRSLFGRLIDGDFRGLRFLVIANNGEASRRLFHYLGELKAREAALPEVHFFDVQPQGRPSSQAYSRAEIHRLAEVLGNWAGQPFSAEALRSAVTKQNTVRSLLRRLMEFRRGEQVFVTGLEALCLLDAENYMYPEDQAALFRATLDEVSTRQPIAGTQVFVTGSPLEHGWAYRMIEDAGGVVVGEDHEWGETQLWRHIIDDDDPLEALVAAYSVPLTASMSGLDDRVARTCEAAVQSSAKAALCLILEGDPTPAWDYPSQAAALSTVGIPTRLIDQLTPDTAAPAVVGIAEFLRSVDSAKVAS